ncbi:hypothetical protein [Salinactinospora qingdaonensis]|uniref:Uncharacterized protein n=1 Tax=Salinactinospora qingdaonensis TaxID=702744 RepID=A0ABP7G3P8_9ACTN
MTQPVMPSGAGEAERVFAAGRPGELTQVVTPSLVDEVLAAALDGRSWVPVLECTVDRRHRVQP